MSVVADEEKKQQKQRKYRAEYHAELLAGLAGQRKRERSQAEHLKLGGQSETVLITGLVPPTWDELDRVIPLEDKKNPAARSVRVITTLSPDTIKRHYPDKVRQLSPRRLGMTIRNALAIAGINIPEGT